VYDAEILIRPIMRNKAPGHRRICNGKGLIRESWVEKEDTQELVLLFRFKEMVWLTDNEFLIEKELNSSFCWSLIPTRHEFDS